MIEFILTKKEKLYFFLNLINYQMLDKSIKIGQKGSTDLKLD